jgi:bla regulator protein BlaR1
MPALFIFLLKVNIALLLFCAGYYLVLRHLTFYTLNRIYLVSAIIFATIYPKINLNGFAQRHQQLAQPVQLVAMNIQVPTETLVKPLVQPVYWHWAEIIFFAGATFLAIRLIMQLFSLYKVYKSSKSADIYGHSVRVINGNDGPFSFWKNIYVNPASYEPDDLKSILQHEQIHTDQWHTVDILLAELSVIFYWFNPGVWLMRKAVRENIEFITDRKILRNGIDSKKYQYSLLNVSFTATQPGIANHFNISTLKKRIIMMNAKRSSRFNLTRYAFLIPVVLICLFAFSFSKAEIIKKSKSTYKTLTLQVTQITRMATIKLDAKYVTTLFERKDTIKKINGVNLFTSDTNKVKAFKQMVMIKTNLNYSYNIGPDSIKILRGMPMDTIKRISIVTNYNIKGSNDSSNHRITRVRLNGYNIRPDSIRVVAGRLAKYKTDTTRIANIRVNGYNINKDSVIYIVNGKRLDNKDLKDLSPNDIEKIEVVKSTQPAQIIITSRSGKSDDPEVLLNRMRGLSVSSSGIVTLTATQQPNKVLSAIMIADGSHNHETNIDNISSKLIIIDGKEASPKEFKKLSVADIKSISIKSGDEMIKQYGAKAKDGVVFIITKKSK